jgi:hypothetical protein
MWHWLAIVAGLLAGLYAISVLIFRQRVLVYVDVRGLINGKDGYASVRAVRYLLDRLKEAHPSISLWTSVDLLVPNATEANRFRPLLYGFGHRLTSAARLFCLDESGRLPAGLQPPSNQPARYQLTLVLGVLSPALRNALCRWTTPRQLVICGNRGGTRCMRRLSEAQISFFQQSSRVETFVVAREPVLKSTGKFVQQLALEDLTFQGMRALLGDFMLRPQVFVTNFPNYDYRGTGALLATMADTIADEEWTEQRKDDQGCGDEVALCDSLCGVLDDWCERWAEDAQEPQKEIVRPWDQYVRTHALPRRSIVAGVLDAVLQKAPEPLVRALVDSLLLQVGDGHAQDELAAALTAADLLCGAQDADGNSTLHDDKSVPSLPTSMGRYGGRSDSCVVWHVRV